MPIFYVPWDKASLLKTILHIAVLYTNEQLSEEKGFAEALLDQIDQEWAKDKENYKRFLKRGIDYDESVRGHSETSPQHVGGGAGGQSPRCEEEQVPSPPGKEAAGEEEEHF